MRLLHSPVTIGVDTQPTSGGPPVTSALRRRATPIAAALVIALAACSSASSTSPAASSPATDSPSTSATALTTGSSSVATSPSAGGVARSTVETKTGVAYATTSPSQTLDLYLPASDGSKPVPIVVLIHGGAFKMGSSAMESGHAQALVAQGIAAASVNYRLSGEAQFPAGAQDVKAAVRWLRANAATLGIDPTRIGAWGESAGGWMANMLGATGDQATVYDDASLGNAAESSAVRAVVSWFGPTDFTSMDSQADETKCTNPDVHGTAGSPESVWLGEAVATSSTAQLTNLTTYVATASTLPAWYLAHGDSDCQVSPGQSAELATALADEGGTVTYVILPGAGHADSAFDLTQLTPTVDFLVATLIA